MKLQFAKKLQDSLKVFHRLSLNDFQKLSFYFLTVSTVTFSFIIPVMDRHIGDIQQSVYTVNANFNKSQIEDFRGQVTYQLILVLASLPQTDSIRKVLKLFDEDYRMYVSNSYFYLFDPRKETLNPSVLKDFIKLPIPQELDSLKKHFNLTVNYINEENKKIFRWELWKSRILSTSILLQILGLYFGNKVVILTLSKK